MNKIQKPTFEVPPCPDAALSVHEKVLTYFRQESISRVLDVPTGEGAFASKIRALGHQVSCGDMDISQFKVDGIPCRQFNMNGEWPYQDHTFDSVVSIEGIEHLENPWHMIREANRVLRMKGIFLLTTPNILSIKSRLSYLLYGYPNYFHYMVAKSDHGQELPIAHINPIGFLELRHILARSGFVIEAIDANRCLKQSAVSYQLIRFLLQTRGRSAARQDHAKASVRQTLFSPSLLFGEILILKCRKELRAALTNHAE